MKLREILTGIKSFGKLGKFIKKKKKFCFIYFKMYI